MTALEEVRKLQQQGMNEEQIIRTMRDQGTSYKDIADSLAQTRIKAAVEQPDAEPGLYGEGSVPNPSGAEGMQASLMGPSQEFQDSQVQELSPPSPNQPYAAQVQEYPQQYDNSYPQQQQYAQSYQQGASSDVITEIAEQVVAEKLGEIRKHLEKVIDLKTTFETKVESIDDRLKRIEKTIDLLQSSVLRKVGDYVTNIQDIKSELVETQKTFAKLSSQRSQHPHTNHTEHHKTHSSAHHHPQHKK